MWTFLAITIGVMWGVVGVFIFAAAMLSSRISREEERSERRWSRCNPMSEQAD